jgi:serine/threonine protein kinase
MEANLLRHLQHPNIVGYKNSFIDNGVLIIIMEYCEGKDGISNAIVGDLGFHIK